MSDEQILKMKTEIDVLIAPFSKDWGYTQGKSSGAIADAIYLNRPLIMPSFLKHIFDYELISYHSTSEELRDLISRYRSLPLLLPELTEEDLMQFLRK